MQRFLRLRDFDWVLMAMVFLLSALSVLEIYSATFNTKFHGFENKQVLWLVGGTAAMLLLSFIDYHMLLDVIHWIYGFCIVSLVVVLVVGQKVLGARRWIGIGRIHFQPSEWVKLVLIVAVARYFATLAGKELDWKDIGKGFLLVGFPMAAGAEAAGSGHVPDLSAGAAGGAVSGRYRVEEGADHCLRGADPDCAGLAGRVEAVPEGPAYQLSLAG